MNAQSQVPTGLLLIGAIPWLFLVKMETVKTTVSKLGEEFVFRLGIWNLHSVKISELKLGKCFFVFSQFYHIHHYSLTNSTNIVQESPRARQCPSSKNLADEQKGSPWEGLSINKCRYAYIRRRKMRSQTWVKLITDCYETLICIIKSLEFRVTKERDDRLDR